MSAPLLIIAAGGTGGHMFPAQALAEEMLSRGWRVKLSTDARGARYTSGFPEGTEIEEISSATFARGGPLAKLTVPPRILAGVIGAVGKMMMQRPAVVVGFGGYPTIPAMAAAWTLRLPRMIHEQNGVPGQVNRLFATRVDLMACGIWPTDLPEGVTAEHTGNPVRRSVHDRAGASYIAPGDYPIKMVVIGGSQGARVMSEIVPAAVAELPDTVLSNLTVVQQAREEDAESVTQAYARLGVRAQVEPFIHDVPRQFAEAQLIISRAGASSVADIAAIGRPAILIPYPHAAGDHQTANARGLVQAGGAIMIPERYLTASSLAEHIQVVLEDPDGASRMARASLSQGRPDAATALADLVETLAQKGAKS